MSTCRRDELLTVATEALFVSGEPIDGDPGVIRERIRTTLGRLRFGGCAARMAQEFGDHPDTAADRMCRCIEAVHHVYPEVTQ